ncbi:MAG: glycosyltransferase family 2 protein [Opitutae bacterium]|nr:glycosyltransferase family 2 protein [Opitutae bacterium]
MLTKNSGAHLGAALAALAWCDEIVVFDTGSVDDTRAIATAFPNVTWHQCQGRFPGFGTAHRLAAGLARHDWILSIDSDEVVSPALADEIRALALDPHTVYALPFQNYYNGRHITTCGWQREYHERLFCREVTDFSDRPVHEKVATEGLLVRRLRHPVQHYSYDSLDDFLRKMQVYTSLFASQHAGRKSGGAWHAWAHGAWAFLKCYVLQQGFRQGAEGFTISTYNAHTAVWKYLKLGEANRRLST